MGFGSIGHWLILLVVVLILFGRGRVSEIMGDFGKGIKSFKQGLNDEQATPAAPPPPPAQIPAPDANAQTQATPESDKSAQ